MNDAGVSHSIQEQLKRIEKRLDKLEAVSHAQPDMKEMLNHAKSLIKEVGTNPRPQSVKQVKSVLRC